MAAARIDSSFGHRTIHKANITIEFYQHGSSDTVQFISSSHGLL